MKDKVEHVSSRLIESRLNDMDNLLKQIQDNSKEVNLADIVITNPPFGRYYTHDENYFLNHRLGDIALEHLIQIIDMLKPGDQTAVLLPEGVFYRAENSRNILRNIVSECNLNLVIHLPFINFVGTNLKEVSIFLFNKNSNNELKK